MRASRRFRRRALVAAAMLEVFASGVRADVAATWLSAADGTWSDAANWSSGLVPDNGNGGNNYLATIGAAGSPYSVTLNTGATVSGLTISSADATLVNNGSLSTSGTINLLSGTFRLAGGTISGGTVSQNGG